MSSKPLSNKRTTNLDWEATCRRASGRRHYNSVRQFLANYRLTQLVELLHETGFRRGYQTQIAKELGVHRSTICRDLARLRQRMLLGPQADKLARAMTRLDRRARAEDAAESQTLALDSVVSEPEAHDEHPRPPAAPTMPVPKWLPAHRSSLASRVSGVSPGVRASGRR
jgi:hypothetical protein